MELRLTDDGELDELYRWKREAILLDMYGSSSTLAAWLSAAALPFAPTGIGAIVSVIAGAYAAATESLDLVIAPTKIRGVIKNRYGFGRLANLETLLEVVPFLGTDLLPAVSLAHNCYLDDLREQGYAVQDDMYVAYPVFEQIRPFIRTVVGSSVHQEKPYGF